MNKSMVIGLIGGIGIATAGGVAGYALLSQSADSGASGTAVVEEAVPVDADVVDAAPVAATTAAAAQRSAPAQQPVAAQRPVPSASAPAVAARQEPVSEPVAEQRCWDEEVTVQAEPKDDKAIAGTAAGAVLGGAIAKKLGDNSDVAAAAGAAAGAFAGRRLQRRVQENNTTTVIEHRCEPVQ